MKSRTRENSCNIAIPILTDGDLNTSLDQINLSFSQYLRNVLGAEDSVMHDNANDVVGFTFTCPANVRKYR